MTMAQVQRVKQTWDDSVYFEPLESRKTKYYGNSLVSKIIEDTKQNISQLENNTVTLESNDELKENKVFFVPDAKQNKKQSVSHDLIIEEWEGLIKNIDEDCFKADLCKKNSNVSESIVADFSISDVPEDERHLVKPGMIFYWYIRKEVKKSGTISNGESLMFRRMPSWKHFDLNKKTTKSDEFFNFLSTESSE